MILFDSSGAIMDNEQNAASRPRHHQAYIDTLIKQRDAALEAHAITASELVAAEQTIMMQIRHAEQLESRIATDAANHARQIEELTARIAALQKPVSNGRRSPRRA